MIYFTVGIFEQIMAGTFQVNRPGFGESALPFIKKTIIKTKIAPSPENQGWIICKIVKTAFGFH